MNKARPAQRDGEWAAIFTMSKTRLRTLLPGSMYNTGKLRVCWRRNQFRELADKEMTK